jgi:hypothetical protein
LSVAFAKWFFGVYVDHPTWRRWWATVSGIPTIQPNAQSIESDNNRRKRTGITKLRINHEDLAAGEWEKMLVAEASRIAPISRAPDMREVLGHPPEAAVKVKAAVYCSAVQCGIPASAAAADVPCTMWCTSANIAVGPWFMRHSERSHTPTTWREMAALVNGFTSSEQPIAAPAAEEDEEAQEQALQGAVPIGGGSIPQAIYASEGQVGCGAYCHHVILHTMSLACNTFYIPRL